LGCYGVRKGIEIMKAKVLSHAWVTEMLAAGNKSFYTVTDGATHFTIFLLKHKRKFWSR
jgi:3-hydroxyacyl-CoA dehydrogenase